ncbi:MAG: class I SAM-dependent methyltransferase [Thermomicrobiales bacterium]|nr:class I SAM-dependent methyltransferase [Thermomicrobiales bacterium]
MQQSDGAAWQSSALVQTFLGGMRGGLPLAVEQIEVMLRLLAGRAEPVRRFIDLGSGDGILAAAILERYPDATATLVDFSAPMLDAAQARFANHAEALRFIRADFGDAAWVATVADDAPYDAIVSGFAIQHLEDAAKQRVYREIFELLTPGGLFVNLDHVASPTPWLSAVSGAALVDSFAAHQRRLGGSERAAHEFVNRSNKAVTHLALLADQLGWLRDIGYVDVDGFFKFFEFAVFGGRRP